MSKFSLRCDFLDHLEMTGVLDSQEKFEEFKVRSRVYINRYPDEDELLTFEAPEDLIPYYTHIIGSACYNNGTGNYIRLTSKSWLELEEERYYPTRYRLRLMKEFDQFVREHGKEPLWAIALPVG